MTRTITQRELRKEAPAIMRGLERGESFVVTRAGVPVGELLPLRRRRFIPAESAAAAFHAAPSIDYETFRDELDDAAGQGSAPQA